jgi:polyisoprenoid-binding protein YceI
MKNKLVVVLIGLLVVGLIGFLVVQNMYKNAKRNVNTEQAIATTPEKLLAAFTANEAAANAQFIDKTVEISGIVQSIESIDNSQTLVKIGTNSAASIACTFSSAINFKPTDSVAIKGICTGYVNDVLLGNCLATSVTPITKNTTTTTVPTTQKIDTSKSAPAVTDKLTTSKGIITFDAGGGIEDIKATNNQVFATLNNDGTINCKAAMLAFKFADALMQQHFNEEYVESKKYPSAIFDGKLATPINTAKDGSFNVPVTGKLTLHGITKPINTTANIVVKSGKVAATTDLKVILADYKVKSAAADEAVIKIKLNF